MRFPEAFKKGDTVAMTATSFPMGPEVIKQCVRALEEEGYRVKLSRCIKEGRNFHNYLAGDGKSRAEDLHELFADSEVKAIFCLRGGYGSSHMMRYLDFDLIRKYPKPFIGYSDVTNLNVALNQFCDLVTFPRTDGVQQYGLLLRRVHEKQPVPRAPYGGRRWNLKTLREKSTR